MPSFSDTEEFETILEIVLDIAADKARRAALDLSGIVKAMRSSGMSDDAIRENLLRDFAEGGRIFASFKSQFTSSLNSGVERASHLVSNSIYKSELPRETLYTWVLTKQNNCEDCIERSTRDAQTLEQWELEGLPQSGVTVCGDNCGCYLSPDSAGVTLADEREPISANE